MANNQSFKFSPILERYSRMQQPQPQPQQNSAYQYRPTGLIDGPGDELSDSITARIGKDEYVLPGDTVRAIGVDTLDQIKDATHTSVDLQMQGVPAGGPVGMQQFANGGEIAAASSYIIDPYQQGRSIGEYWSRNNAEFEAQNPSIIDRVARTVAPNTGFGSAVGNMYDAVGNGNTIDAILAAVEAAPLFAAKYIPKTDGMVKAVPDILKTTKRVGRDVSGNVGIDYLPNFANGGSPSVGDYITAYTRQVMGSNVTPEALALARQQKLFQLQAQQQALQAPTATPVPNQGVGGYVGNNALEQRMRASGAYADGGGVSPSFGDYATALTRQAFGSKSTAEDIARARMAAELLRQQQQRVTPTPVPVSNLTQYGRGDATARRMRELDAVGYADGGSIDDEDSITALRRRAESGIGATVDFSKPTANTSNYDAERISALVANATAQAERNRQQNLQYLANQYTGYVEQGNAIAEEARLAQEAADRDTLNQQPTTSAGLDNTSAVTGKAAGNIVRGYVIGSNAKAKALEKNPPVPKEVKAQVSAIDEQIRNVQNEATKTSAKGPNAAAQAERVAKISSLEADRLNLLAKAESTVASANSGGRAAKLLASATSAGSKALKIAGRASVLAGPAIGAMEAKELSDVGLNLDDPIMLNIAARETAAVVGGETAALATGGVTAATGVGAVAAPIAGAIGGIAGGYGARKAWDSTQGKGILTPEEIHDKPDLLVNYMAGKGYSLDKLAANPKFAPAVLNYLNNNRLASEQKDIKVRQAAQTAVNAQANPQTARQVSSAVDKATGNAAASIAKVASDPGAALSVAMNTAPTTLQAIAATKTQTEGELIRARGSIYSQIFNIPESEQKLSAAEFAAKSPELGVSRELYTEASRIIQSKVPGASPAVVNEILKNAINTRGVWDYLKQSTFWANSQSGGGKDAALSKLAFDLDSSQMLTKLVTDSPVALSDGYRKQQLLEQKLAGLTQAENSIKELYQKGTVFGDPNYWRNFSGPDGEYNYNRQMWEIANNMQQQILYAQSVNKAK